MPTRRARHVVTEVDEIAAALDEAAHVWPEYRDQRGKLLQRLIAEGYKAIHDERAGSVEKRRAAIRAGAGFMEVGFMEVGFMEVTDDQPDSVEFVRRLRDSEWPG